MRKQPVIEWAGSPQFIQPDLTGIAKQDINGQLKITPERIAKAEAKNLFAGLLQKLGQGKW